MKRVKKIITSFLVAICIAMISIFCLACSKNTNNNKIPPNKSNSIQAPYIISFGTFISWNKVAGASSYSIYCNSELVETIPDTTYKVDKLDSDVEYYICANCNSSISEKSNTILVSKNHNYANDETLDLSNQYSYFGEIPPNTRKIIIGKDSKTIFNLSISISDRKTDLIFELSNVELMGQIFNKNNSYERFTNNYNIIFQINGDCSIKGNNGLDGTSYNTTEFDNKEIDGLPGKDGQTAILCSTLIVRGNGNLSIYGGNGGNGSSTTAWETNACPGTGSNGGNGGAGIKTSYILLDLDANENKVTIKDGKGGKKGNPGTNGSIFTGPACSAMWNDMFEIGNPGINGSSILGTKYIIKGNLVK